MIKYRALQDIKVGKRVVNFAGEIVLTRLPEGSRVQGSLMSRDKEIPVKMKTATGYESKVSLPEYYPCRLDKDLRESILRDFRKNRSAWGGGVEKTGKGESKMADNTKKIANWEKWLATQEAGLKAAKKAKDKKKIAKFEGEVEYGVEYIAKLKAAPSKEKGSKDKSEGVEFVMLKYA